VADAPAAAAEQRLFLFLSSDAKCTIVAAAAPAAREAPSRLRAKRVAEKNIGVQQDFATSALVAVAGLSPGSGTKIKVYRLVYRT
jgi:hypothetical protein